MKRTGELKRHKPLERKSALKNKSDAWKHRRNPRARMKEFTDATKQAVRERSQGVCEICGQRQAVHFHHVVFRSHIQGEAARHIRNCLHLCQVCHVACHKTKAMRDYAEERARQLA